MGLRRIRRRHAGRNAGTSAAARERHDRPAESPARQAGAEHVGVRTGNRDEQVDFTIPYRMTKDAFVAAGDSTLVIEKPEDAAGKSIGAQTGTVQESWIQDTLVAAGLTPADQVFSYERADQAALDVASGRIELLLMDAEPSIALAEETGLKILLITELTAEGGKSIAIPDGAADLKAELDRIIQELIDDGTVQRIQEANGLP